MHGRVAIAAGNRLGAEAGAKVAAAGGNAVDACLASGVMGWVAEPFFASAMGSGFIAVRTPSGDVEIADGNTSMPHTTPTEVGQGIRRVFLDYSNGMYTGVGGGSVAVPGIVAAMHLVWQRHGRIEWHALFEHAIDVARQGLPFPRTSAYYLTVTKDVIWTTPEARALFFRDGEPLLEGDILVQDDLADALEMIAGEGPAALYDGALGLEIEKSIAEDGGFLGSDDLRRYRAELRAPLRADAFGWSIQTNPPPAVGGAVLCHMLALLADADLDDEEGRTRAIVEAQRAAMGYRRENYQDPESVAVAFERALGSLRGGSGETTHSSAADADGYACALTESNGYGAGLVVHGVMLNNALGEEELNPLGIHSLPPGSRCHSNMAPTIATGPDCTVALGSPGADRIVSAITQTLIRLAVDGDSLADAVAAPRLHLDMRPDGDLLCYEPGIPGAISGYDPRPYPDFHMYFGGVQAALVTRDGRVEAAVDPRRTGGTSIV